jgi:hypothetical protein
MGMIPAVVRALLKAARSNGSRLIEERDPLCSTTLSDTTLDG